MTADLWREFLWSVAHDDGAAFIGVLVSVGVLVGLRDWAIDYMLRRQRGPR